MEPKVIRVLKKLLLTLKQRVRKNLPGPRIKENIVRVLKKESEKAFKKNTRKEQHIGKKGRGEQAGLSDFQGQI